MKTLTLGLIHLLIYHPNKMELMADDVVQNSEFLQYFMIHLSDLLILNGRVTH
jgi:hypothetical protein